MEFNEGKIIPQRVQRMEIIHPNEYNEWKLHKVFSEWKLCSLMNYELKHKTGMYFDKGIQWMEPLHHGECSKLMEAKNCN